MRGHRRGGAPLPLSARTADAALLGAATLDFAAEQRTARRPDDRAQRPVATAIDCATHQRTGRAADDQAGGAVRATAIDAAVLAAPSLILRLRRIGRNGGDRHGKRRRAQGENELAHRIFPFFRCDPDMWKRPLPDAGFMNLRQRR